MTLASQTAYVGELVVRTIFLGLILYVFVQLWTATYAAMGVQTVAGFTIAQMVWYLTVTESILMSRPRLTLQIDAEVRAGELAYQLIRPYDYMAFRLAAYAAERALRMCLTLVVGAAVALVLVGPIPLSPSALAAAGLLIVLGTLVDFFAVLAIGICAFWLEDTQPLTLLYDRAIMLLGGLLLPLELFPDWIARLLTQLPFQLLLYAPGRAVVSGDLSPLPTALLQLAVWLVAMLVLARAVFGYAVRRLHANGG